MSIQSVREMLQVSIAEYNGKKQALQKMFFNDNEHTESWKHDQMKIQREKMQEEYAGVLIDLQSKIENAESETALKIGRLKYPSATSTLEAVRTSGELQLNSAQLFLMKERSYSSIVSSIKQAFTLGRIDFAFGLIDGLKELVSSKSASEYPSDAEMQALKQVQEMVDSFDRNGLLMQLDKDMQAIPEISQTARAFKQFISKEETTAIFVPMSEIRSMNEAEMLQVGMESINASIGAVH
jgi:hypothetical protein